MTIQLLIKTLTGATISVYADPSDSAETIREKIRAELKDKELKHQHAEDFQIIFAGKEFQSGRTLADYNITEDGTVLNGILRPALSQQQEQSTLVENTDEQMKSGLLATKSEKNASKNAITFNPMRAFIENSAHPAARIYRESIWMGFLDTYKVFVGNHYTGQLRMGIIDVLVFPAIGSALVKYGQKNNNGIATLLGGALELGRGLIGGALTLAVSPIVLGVHLIAAPKARKLKNTLKQVQVYQVSPADDKNAAVSPKNTTLSLLEMLKKDKSELTEIRCNEHEETAKIPSPKDRTYTSYGWCIKSGKYKPRFDNPINFKVDYDKTPPEALEAFEALNVGRLHI